MTNRTLAVVATFTALALASDFGLADALNVKLVDPIVFSVAFVFGLEAGISVGVLSEVIWGTVSPFGFGGYVIPFLAGGEVLFAVAGWAASRVWSGQESRLSPRNAYFGATLAMCAFLWDLETNAATALLVYSTHLNWKELVATEVLGIWPFMIAHEVSDFVTGALLAPAIIFYAARFLRPSAPARASRLEAL